MFTEIGIDKYLIKKGEIVHATKLYDTKVKISY